jgi:GDP-L-fucose synthase
MEKLITPEDRIFVAGHRGMAGSAICRALERAGYSRILTATREQLDLLDASAVERWFAEHHPTVVVLAAAKVGGIHANNCFPADFLLENIRIQTNVIETAWRSGVRRLLFLGSSCIYPKFAEQPIREEALLTGLLEPTNEWYAIAKIAGIKLCQALRLQHGFDAISLMPTNLYGPGDNYHPTNSHVLPALIRRFHEAAERGDASVTCWGTGTPLREFLHVDDLGESCVFSLEHWDPASADAPLDIVGEPLPFLNVGTGLDLTIRQLAEAVAGATGYQGEIVWDISKPDGTPKKQLDVSRLQALGWQAQIPLANGLNSTVALFREDMKSNILRR